jgi:hypothetical protein
MVLTAALLGLAGRTGTNGLGTSRTVHWLTAADGEHQTGDHLFINPRTYTSEPQSSDRPWPFGWESDQP